MSDKQEPILAVLGTRAIFQVLVWDKESGRAKLLTRFGAEFVVEIAEFTRWGYSLVKALRIETNSLGGAIYRFVKPDGKPFNFPKGQF